MIRPHASYSRGPLNRKTHRCYKLYDFVFFAHVKHLVVNKEISSSLAAHLWQSMFRKEWENCFVFWENHGEDDFDI